MAELWHSLLIWFVDNKNLFTLQCSAIPGAMAADLFSKSTPVHF